MHYDKLDENDQQRREDEVAEHVHDGARGCVVDDQTQQGGDHNADDVQLHDGCAAEDGEEETGAENGILLLEGRPGTLRPVLCRWILVSKGAQSFGDRKGQALVLYQHGNETLQSDEGSQQVSDVRRALQIHDDRVRDEVELHRHGVLDAVDAISPSSFH